MPIFSNYSKLLAVYIDSDNMGNNNVGSMDKNV